MEGHASISPEVIARYASDAALEVEGVRGLVESHLPRHRGVYRRPGATLHVSPGLGTTFLPLRFFARPEATELILESG